MRAFGSIYNSKYGVVNLEYGLNGTARFAFSPVFQPVEAAQIVKGMKIYDYQSTRVFSLSLDESIMLYNLIKEAPQKSVDLGNTKVNVTDNVYSYSVTHYPGSKDEKQSHVIAVSQLRLTVGRVNPNCMLEYFFSKRINKEEVEKSQIKVPFTSQQLDVVKLFLKMHPTAVAVLHILDIYTTGPLKKGREANGLSASIPMGKKEDDYFSPIETSDQLDVVPDSGEAVISEDDLPL